MEIIKRESECCFCFSKEDLFSMLEPYNFEDNVEIYSTMIADCFQIELSSYVEDCDRSLYLICKNCVYRLRDAIMFRSQIQMAYNRLQAKYTKRDDRGDIKSECSNVVDTKYHIKYDISDYDNNMEDIKRESECCCCFGKEDLFSMLEPYNFEENVEIYSTMIADCFQIQLGKYVEDCDRNRYLICKNCVYRLRDAILLRPQVQIAYDRLQAERRTKMEDRDQLVDTKEHIIKNEISECVNSGASLSNVNVSKFKVVNVILEKIDNKTIENVSIVAACRGSGSTFPPPNITYLCNICNKLFENLHAVQEHKRSHLNVEIFRCEHCKKELRSKARFREHVLSHVGVKNVKCDLCDKYFVCKRILWNHKRACHSARLNCDICGKTLYSRRTLNLHALSHSGAKNEKCDVCGKAFARKDTLRHHKRTHFETNKKKCKYCDKAFRTKYEISRHEKIHLDIKDLICDYCNREFRQKWVLKEHILSHMNIKNVQCDMCDKYFVSETKVSKHKRTYHSVKVSKV